MDLKLCENLEKEAKEMVKNGKSNEVLGAANTFMRNGTTVAAGIYYKVLADDCNHIESAYIYGNIMHDEKNYSEAIKYIRQAANGDHAKAMCNYGYMLEYGEGTQVDINKALIYYKRSAALGYEIGKYNYINLTNRVNQQRGV